MYEKMTRNVYLPDRCHGLIEGLRNPNVGKVHETWGVYLTQPLPQAAAGSWGSTTRREPFWMACP
jgi:hypothetical protein